MTPCICPNCGLHLEKLEDSSLGDLHVSGEFGMVTWKGKVPHLTKTERLIVLALAAARGRIMRPYALMLAGGFEETANPDNQLRVMLNRIRHAFRDLDPEFDRIKNQWGIGYRWAVEAGEMADAA